jgi:hypothetical protein
MTKKTTLKHMQPDGEIVTRTTARAYTCVLLRKYNVAALLAAHDAKETDDVAASAKRAREDFKHNQLCISTPVGGPIPYEKNQGGYKRYADGTLATHPMPDYYVELARKSLARDGDTLEAFVASRVQATLTERAGYRAQLAAYTEEWHVISWHGSARSAKPQFTRAGDQYRVEPINNGTRA